MMTLEATEIVLCAGGIKTPQLLQLSGVGPAELLTSLGIPVVRDLPAVGKYVRDHPSVAVAFEVEGQTDDLATRLQPAIQVCLTLTSPDCGDVDDLQISCMSASFSESMRTARFESGWLSHVPSWAGHPFRTARALGGINRQVVMTQIATQRELRLLCQLHRELSEGEIAIGSTAAADDPLIRLNYLSHPDDLPRMRYNVRQALAILSAPSFTNLGARVISPSDVNTFSDEVLDEWIVENLSTAFHTLGGARMGSDEATSVVDQYGRVHGLRGLRVADISIAPSVIRRSPHATAVMLGERFAGFFDA
jgi:choline dehydrogenase